MAAASVWFTEAGTQFLGRRLVGVMLVERNVQRDAWQPKQARPPSEFPPSPWDLNRLLLAEAGAVAVYGEPPGNFTVRTVRTACVMCRLPQLSAPPPALCCACWAQAALRAASASHVRMCLPRARHPTLPARPLPLPSWTSPRAPLTA